MSDETKTNVLDLNDLFGVSNPIVVRVPAGLLGTETDREFRLMRPEAFSAKQILEFEKLDRELTDLKKVTAESITDEQAQEMEDLMRKILLYVSDKPKLPVDKLTFIQLTKVLEHYFNEVSKSKKVLETPINKPIGAAPSEI